MIDFLEKDVYNIDIDRDIFRVETRKSCTGYGTGKTSITFKSSRWMASSEAERVLDQYDW